MARRALSAEEESELIRAAEDARDTGAELIPVKARRGPNATAVLSVRVTADQLQALRALAEKRRMSLAAIVQEAVRAYAATGGGENFVSRGGTFIINQEPPRSRAYPTPPLFMSSNHEPELATG